MSSIVEGILFQFRCPSCFRALRATTDQVAESYVCPHCGAGGDSVPEATESRIAAADRSSAPVIGADAADAPAAGDDRGQEPAVSYEQAYAEFQKQFGFTASPLVRLFARMIDGVLMGLTMMISFFLGELAAGSLGDGSNAEPGPLVMIVLLSVAGIPPLLLAAYQWAWTASEGKTIGKNLLGIRIVMKGDEMPPGFFWGVFMRSWVNYLLGTLPFYSLADALFIFDQGKCLHDRLAGTIVIAGGTERRSAA